MQLREQYHRCGPAMFSDTDVLACVIGRPSGSGRVVATRLVEHFGGLAGLVACETQELRRVVGVGSERAVRVHAAFELGRRARVAERALGPEPVCDPNDARAWLVPALTGLRHEELHALFLDRRRRVLAHRRLTVGSDSFTVVDPRQVFRVALGVGAHAVVLAHNHPSGDPRPSRLDIAVTQRVVDAGAVVGVRLVDHLVVGAGGSCSFAEEGLLEPDPNGPSGVAAEASGHPSAGW